MNKELFKIMCEASPEFREAMLIFSIMSEKEGRSLKENLELWDGSTLPSMNKKRDQNAINNQCSK